MGRNPAWGNNYVYKYNHRSITNVDRNINRSFTNVDRNIEVNMGSTYTTNGGIEKIGTGEQSGTWGDTTNTNFDIIDKLTNGVTEIDVGSSTTSNLDTSDGTVTNGMSKVLVYTTSGTQSQAHTVTITIVAAEKLYFINNTLGQNLQFVQDGSTPTEQIVLLLQIQQV